MKIKKATISNIEDIMNMYSSCVTGMIKNGIDQWDDTYPNRKVILNDIKNKSYFVYEIENEIIGGISIDKNESDEYIEIEWEDTENKFLVVHRLGVKEEYWKKGIGKELMGFAENLVRNKTLNSIRLDTYSGNPYAMNFYKKIGYKQLGYIYLKEGKNEYYCFEKIIK